MKEGNVLRRIQIALSDLGARLFRNNCGAFKDSRGVWVKFGVANPGGSDLIGWTPVVIRPEMVGRTVAIFCAVEVKAEKGKVTLEQAHFLGQVRESGGIAFVARSSEDAVEQLNARS